MNNEKYNMLDKVHLLVKSKAGKTKYHCPVCDRNDFDVKPSNGTYGCFSGGCTTDEIRVAIDKLEGKQFTPGSKTIDRPIKSIRTKSSIHYDYPNRDGSKLVRVARIDDGKGGKPVRYQEHWDGFTWQKGVPADVKPNIAIYRYAEVQQAILDDRLIFVVEGEPCADALWDIGIPATTTIAGTAGFAANGDYTNDFDGGRFVLSPDCDAVGIKYIANFTALLGDKVHGYYLAGSNADLWVEPCGGFDIKDDITDRHLDRDRILASVISADEYRKVLNPEPKKPVGRPRKPVDESVEKKEKTPARDLVDPVLENVYRDVIRYDADEDRYWAYDRGVWTCCANSFVYTLVQKYLIKIDEPYTDRLVTEVVKLARGFVKDAKWSEVKDVKLIPFEDGVLDIETKTLLHHSPDYEFRWQLPRKYSPTSDKSSWNKIDLFLDELSGGNKQLRNILLAFCNRALLGRCGSPKFLYLSGSGGNGKGVFLDLIEGLVGKNNVKTTSLASLNENRFEPANIRDKRIVICPDEDKTPDSLTVFKSATGGDKISCEYKCKQAIDFKYDGIFVIAANEPIFQGKNKEAMRRRKVEFPCLNQPLEKDEHLIEKLLVQLPEFTTYILGLDPNWVKKTIVESDKVDAIAMLAREMSIQENNVAAYYHNQLVVDPDASVSTLSLYKDYEAYCNQNNLKPCSGNRFPKSLWELCHDSLKIAISDKRISNVRHFVGIRIATPMDVLPDADLMLTTADLSAVSEPILRQHYADYADLSNNKLIYSNKLNNYIEEEVVGVIKYIKEESNIGLLPSMTADCNYNAVRESVSSVSTTQHDSAEVSKNTAPIEPGQRVYIPARAIHGYYERLGTAEGHTELKARIILEDGKRTEIWMAPEYLEVARE